MNRNNKGFSLTEMLVVVFILMVIGSLMLQIFVRVTTLNRAANEELFSQTAMEIFQQRFVREVREASQIRQLPAPKSGGQSLQIGDVVYTTTPPRNENLSWRIERFVTEIPDPLIKPALAPLPSAATAVDRIGRIPLGTRVSDARFSVQSDGMGHVTLVTLTVKLRAATGGRKSEREFVFAAHPRR